MLRAPDISVGDIPDEPGWATVAPPLAVEYADTGQDEADLERKIEELLAAGTRFLWVVRLDGARRVEGYEAPPAPRRRAPARATGVASPVRRLLRPSRVAYPGEELVAPGVLQNPVPVEALYDRKAAHEATLRNLLQRKGYAGLDAVKEEGRRQERVAALRAWVRDVCELLGIALSPERAAALDAMEEAELGALRDHLKRNRCWP